MNVLVAFDHAVRNEAAMKKFREAGFAVAAADDDSLSAITAPTVLVTEPYIENFPNKLEELKKASQPTLALVRRGVFGDTQDPIHRVVPITNMGFDDDLDYMARQAREFFEGISACKPA